MELDESKCDSLRESFGKASKDAAEILSLLQQLRDLEGKFESAKETLLKQEEELRKREEAFEKKVNERQDERNSKVVLARNEVEECNRMLISKRNELALVQKEHRDCTEDLAAKKKQLVSLIKCVNDRYSKMKSEETELSKVQKQKVEEEQHLHKIKGMIRDFNEKLGDKERKFQAMNSSMDKLSAEFTEKQKQLDLVKVEISKKCGELEAKTKQRDSVNNSIMKCCVELAEKQKQVELICRSINELAKTRGPNNKEGSKTFGEKLRNCEALELKLNSVQESMKARNEELALKEKELKLVQIAIIERRTELEALKKQEILSEKSVTECSEELESKKNHLDLVEKSSLECCASKESALTSESFKELEEKLEANQRQLELKEEKIQLMQKLVDELSRKLEYKEKQLTDKLPFELAIVEVNSSTVDYQSCIVENGKYLQSLLNESFRKHESVQNEVFSAIQKSTDPGKLVLDSIQGFDLKEQDIEFDSSVIKRSCSTLLEQLLKISPEIKPEIREEAMKVALEWKSKMKMPCENTLEVSVFLQMLAAFKLSSSFSHDELQSFLDAIYPNRQVLQLRKALGFAEGSSVTDLEQIHPLRANQQENSSGVPVDPRAFLLVDERAISLILEDDINSPDLMPQEIISALRYTAYPASFVLDVMSGSYSQHLKNGGLELDGSVVENEIRVMEQLARFKPIITRSVKEGAAKLASLWKENMIRETSSVKEAWAFLLFLSIYGLRYHFRSDEILRVLAKVANMRQAPDICRSLCYADKIPKLIPILLEKKQFIDAARFSCAFGLLHIFPLDSIQQNCFEHLLRSAQDQAREGEISFRKAMLQCISENKLDSIYDTSGISRRIMELETQRASSSAVNLQGGSYSGVDIRSSVNHQPPNAPFAGTRYCGDKRPRIG